MQDFAQSIESLHRALVKRATRLGDPHEAEDVAQDAKLALWKKGEDYFTDAEHLQAYAFNTVKNLCASRHHATLRRATPVDELPELLDDADTEQTFVRREAVDFTLNAIEELPARHRRVMLANIQTPKNYAAIAAATGESHTAVRNLLNRGRDMLRVKFEAAGHTLGGIMLPASLRAAWQNRPRILRPNTPKGRTALAAGAAVPLLLLPALFHGPGSNDAQASDRGRTTQSVSGPGLDDVVETARRALSPEEIAARQFAEDAKKLLGTKPELLPAPDCTDLVAGRRLCRDSSGEGSNTYILPGYLPENEVFQRPFIYTGGGPAGVHCETYAVEPVMECGPANPEPQPSPTPKP